MQKCIKNCSTDIHKTCNKFCNKNNIDALWFLNLKQKYSIRQIPNYFPMSTFYRY